MKNILFDLTSTQPIRDSKFHGGGITQKLYLIKLFIAIIKII